MSLKLMYITNNPVIAKIAQNNGVDRIFIDMEYIGKELRQGGMNTVQNSHTIDDIKEVKKVLNSSELLVRINPVHEKTEKYNSTEEEIEAVIDAGADIIMLPYFKTVDEVRRFLLAIKGRVKTSLLIETPESVNVLENILNLGGIDEIHIGLNDLSLGYKKSFMFELLIDGTVESICEKINRYGIPYGFGGIASLGVGMIPSEVIIKEHYRLESTCAILSRSFCDTSKIKNVSEIENIFNLGVKEIRNYEILCAQCDDYLENHNILENKIKTIINK